MRRMKDLSGKTFYRLTVLEPGGKTHDGRPLWLCECDCGKLVLARSDLLMNGGIKSCGCIRKNKRKQNVYSFDGKNGYIEFSDGSKCIFDSELYPDINKKYWLLRKDGYAASARNGKTLFLSRYVYELNFGCIPEGMVIDHINRNRLDNRICNLRLCRQIDNAKNRSPNKNRLGVTGVSYNRKRKRWTARITVNKKVIYLGSFDNILDAVSERRDAEERLFKEFRPI